MDLINVVDLHLSQEEGYVAHNDSSLNHFV